MIEEQQQVDILEEHIPKVSDNIFVTHQKKPQRLPAAPAPRSISSESLITATPTYTIAVDNIIIIEKDDKEETKKVDETVPTSDEKKEYPKAGLVHRLMGRFQTEKLDTQEKKSSPTYVSHQKTQLPLQTSENYQASRVESPTPTTDLISSVKDVSPSQPTSSIQKSEPQSESAMQSDMLSPLLMSSAKPFSRQRTDNADRFHHVSKPVRKVSAPVAAKTVVHKSEPKAVLPVDAIPCPPEFADDLSHLHANAQEPEKMSPPKETIVIQKETLPPIESAPQIPKRVNLKNGETLHSSGTESTKKPEELVQGKKPPVPIKRFDPYASLHDKSHLVSRQLPPKVEVKEAVKPNPELAPKAATLTLQSEVTVKESPKQDEPETNDQTAVKENRIYSRSVARRNDKLENEFKKEVHESLEEATLKSSAAKAANRIMQTSKTFKITPSKQAQRNTVSPTPKTDTLSKVDTYSAASSNSHDSLNATLKLSDESPKLPTIPPRRHETEKPTVPTGANKAEPKASTETLRPTGKSTDNSSTIKPPVSTVIKQKEVPRPASQPVKPPQVQAQPKTFTLPAVNSAAKGPMTVQSESKPSIFGPRITKSSSSANRGKSFTIDPSKFKRSSAQPPATSAASGSYQDGSSTRTIVPGAKSQLNPDLEFGGDQPKSGKRKLTVDQITVIGGYVTLEKSCLIKDTKRKKSVTISFSEKDLETTYSYVSERSLLEEDQPSVEFNKVSKSPGFGKDSTIGKYTPKYLLSLKSSEILDNEDDNNESKLVKDSSNKSPPLITSHATPLSDENAIAWSDTTSGSTDILF